MKFSKRWVMTSNQKEIDGVVMIQTLTKKSFRNSNSMIRREKIRRALEIRIRIR